jgi:Protein of unknown function (DUF3455)
MPDSTFALRLAAITLLAITAVGCASKPPMSPPEVPAALRVPAGQQVYLVTNASGVQIYECALNAERAPRWTFRGPEAALTDTQGRPLGKHYAGPSWEAPDGSKTVGQVQASDPGPDRSAIPWLLLNAKSTGGAGLFREALSIHRVQTTGGLAPTRACDAATLGQIERVPYQAVYYFYRRASN